jgi:prepilin signal peptidase PulO-like enzyme (type II secretory pathway)
MLEIALLALFAAAALVDYKYKRIPDLVTALIWVLIILNGIFDFNLTVLAVACMGTVFGFLFLFNTVWINLFNERVYAWGDILLLPTLAGFAVLQFPPYALLAPFLPSALGMPAVIYRIRVKKELKEDIEIRLAPYIFLSAIIFFVVRIAL